MTCRPWLLLLLVWGSIGTARGGEDALHEVYYPPSTQPGELVFGVTYTVWIPAGEEPLRGVIVHQHGCGSGACKGGGTAAYDLHWQALARKWNCALLGPSYHQPDGDNCRLWCDPRNGSDKTFLRGLEDLAQVSGRPELARVPWCLWGHSGGGFWASLMQTLHPERIVAIWFRSGTAIEVWERGEIPKPEIPEAAFGIPMMVNPGVKERDDTRFRSAWTGADRMFQFYRARHAPIGMLLDPKSGHECGDCRYVAIPFFDACLALRLPPAGAAAEPLRSVDPGQGWLAPYLEGEAVPADQFSSDPKTATWLPSAAVAKAWSRYVKSGTVDDASPPPAPHKFTVAADARGVKLQWSAEADFESGLEGFIVLRDGVEIGRVPPKPIGRFGKGLFQTMSYHDTPEKPLATMEFRDPAPPPDGGAYQLRSINTAGGQSLPTSAVRALIQR